MQIRRPSKAAARPKAARRRGLGAMSERSCKAVPMANPPSTQCNRANPHPAIIRVWIP